MKRFIKYLFIIPLAFVFYFIRAENPHLSKNFLTVENGLSHNEVTAIVQDKDGFIWIGTRGGLNRYDGYEFKIFNQIPGDSNSLVNPSVESLFDDSNGNIWIGTKSGGVSKYNPVTGIFKNIASNYKKKNDLLPDNRILCFHEDKKGNIWMGTWESGVIVYNEKTNSSKTYLNGLVSSIVETEDGKIWIGHDNNLYEYLENEDRMQQHPSGSVHEIAYDEKLNALWLAHGNNNGFRKFDLRNQNITQFKIQNSDANLPDINYPFESILIDSKDRIWLGTWGSGLFIFDKNKQTFLKFPIYPENRGSFNKDYDAILDIFEDVDGNIWLGTNGGGVCVLTPKMGFRSAGFNPEKNKGLINTRIMTVVEDQKNNLWLGTIGSGLIWSPDKENFYQVEYPENIDPSVFFVIKNIFEDKNGTIWCGTGPTTFFIRFENGTPKMINAQREFKTSFPPQAVSFLDANEMLWVGGLQQGLFLYDKKNNYRLIGNFRKEGENAPDLRSDRISDLLLDSKGRIWAGTYDGLHIFDNNDTTLVLAENKFEVKGNFTGNIITSLEEDQKGNIWVGTPNGLNKLSENGNFFEVTFYTEKDGLASNFIKGISYDLDANIWVSTNIGISKFDTKHNRFINYTQADGVLGKNFTEASVFRNDETGIIYFGGTDGLTWFNPNEIEQNTEVNEPIFTGLKVLNQQIEANDNRLPNNILEKSIAHTQKIELTYRQNNFEIEFSALDFKSNAGNFYRYKLANLDADWNEIGKRRFVNFNNLRPGEYVLQVQAANSHFIWNENPAELIIVINPPFWQTWYALAFYILIIIGVVSVIRWNAVKQVRLANNLEIEKMQHEQDQKLNEMKLRFFTNLSHEFRTPLTLILAPLKELLSKKDKFGISGETENKINVIQNNAARLMKLVNQLLDFRKVESGNMKLFAVKTNFKEFVDEVCHPFFELAEINNIRFKTNTANANIELWIDRDKMEIILNNLISNAFKYIGENGKIDVSVYEEEDEVLVSVSDNGPGIPATEIKNIFDRFYRIGNKQSDGSSGIGLALAKRFAELHSGNINVTSEPKVHTEFTVSLLKGKNHLQPDQIVDLEPAEHRPNKREQIFGSVFTAKSRQLVQSNLLILVVEDNPELNTYLVNLLSANYKVETARNGKQAIECISENEPDLIISDVMMPEMDGFELCEKIRSTEATSTIPFIFLTAKSDEQFRLLGTQIGADDFISKPFDPALLLEKVKNIMQSREKLKKKYSKSVRLEPSDIEITSGDEIFIEKVIKTVEDNLQNVRFNSEYLATQMNMSNSSLYRKLKNLTGFSTAEFIRSIRIKRAAQLLADKERTITEIAYEVGFNDVKHFRAVFQKQFGCSPSEYREKL